MSAPPNHLRATRAEVGGRDASLRLRGLLVGALLVHLASCAAELPTMQEVNEVVLTLRGYQAWAWALGIGTIWADLFLPVPQTSVIAGRGGASGVASGEGG